MHACNSAISISTKSGTARGLGPQRCKQQFSSSVLPMWLESTQEGLWAADPVSITLCLLKSSIAWVFHSMSLVGSSQHGTPHPPRPEIPRYFASRSELTCLMRRIWCSQVTLSLTVRYMEAQRNPVHLKLPKQCPLLDPPGFTSPCLFPPLAHIHHSSQKLSSGNDRVFSRHFL